MHPLIKILSEFQLSLADRGLKNTILITIATLHGYWEDHQHNLSTASWMSVESFGVDNNKQQNSSPYAPTTNFSLKKILNKLNLKDKQTFLDLGCGKGRVLLFAAAEGFLDIRGIEFSPVLQKIAKQNCSHYLTKSRTKSQAKTQPAQKITILEMDVRDYQFKGDEEIVFMFDPFSKSVLKSVVANMKKPLSTKKCKLTIIYRSPVHKEVFATDPDFSLLLEDVSWGHDFSVYELA